MLVTEYTKQRLSDRRFRRNMKRDGYEPVDEFGCDVIWKMYRGSTTHHKIKDIVIGLDGKSLWVKTAEVRQ